jgi:rsbT co-antagonist protein RsbR
MNLFGRGGTLAASMHVELPLDIYMAGVSVNFENCVEILSSRGKPTQESQRTLVALSKFMHFDMMITADTYMRLTNEALVEQSKSLIEMSTPVTSIWDGILLLPLVGVIDSKRALDITARVLEEIANIWPVASHCANHCRSWHRCRNDPDDWQFARCATIGIR